MKLIRLFIVLSFLGTTSSILAQANLTSATGGTNISIDNTSTGGTGTYSTLTGPVIAEVSFGDIATGLHTLTLPAGWEFNTGQAVTITVDGIGTELTLSSPSYTPDATTLSFTVTTASSSVLGGLTFSNIQVRPTGTTAPTSGNITMTAGSINGLDGSSNFGTLSTTHGTATKYVIINPADGTVDAAITVTVQLQDQFGNIVTTGADKDKDVTLNADGSATGDGLVDIVDGVGTINISDHVAETVNLSLTDTEGTGFNVASTQDVIFTNGVATKYIVTSSNYGPVVGTNVTISAQLADQYDNSVSTAGNIVTWTKSDSHGSFATPSSVTNGSGLATVVFTTYTVVGTATTVTGTTGALTGTSPLITTIAPLPILSSPSNYAVGVSVLPTLDWVAVAGATNYDIEISTDGIAYSVLVAGTGRPFTLAEFDQLISNTLYYWRVKINGGVYDGQYSLPWEFTTCNAQVVINTYYPIGTSANIAWYLIPSAADVQYDLYYSTESDFSPTNQINDIDVTFTTLTDLEPGEDYYVMVRARNTTGTIIYSYSDAVSFTTDDLPQPVCSYPIDGATTYSNPPYLYWYTGAYDNSVEYRVKYWLDGTGEPIDGDVPQSATSGCFETNSFQMYALLTASLTAGETYNWKVRTVKGAVLSDWSAAETFVVYSSTPTEAPVCYPSFPVGGDDCYLNPPSLYWYTGTYATGIYFYVEWDDDDNWADASLGNSGWIDDLYFALPDALDPDTYYWRVRSALTDAGGSPSAWSDTESFVIPASSSSVALPYPTSPVGVTVTTLNPTFTWYATTPPDLTYILRISPYSDTDVNGMLNHATATQLSAAVATQSWTFDSHDLVDTDFELVGGATYYWQVIAYDGATPSNWSYIASFNTAAGLLVIVPFVVSPIQEQPINNTSVMLTWDLPVESFAHLNYSVEYSKVKDFNNSITVADVNERLLKIDGLDENSKYYWRVSARNFDGSVSNFSNIGSFKTSSATDISELNELPEEFSLEQNYPNPFNPTTQISYSLPENSFVTLKIYDMLGREVRTLVNENNNAGRTTVDWNGEDNFGRQVSSGAYIYRITAGKFVSVKKMLFLK